jgi:ABC-type multidrug transport system permease subunit
MNAQLAERESSPISLGDWMITLLILCIPLVGIIMLFVWGFADGTHPSKRNFCRAYLIWMLIGIVIFVLFLIMGGMAALMGARAMGGATL